MSSSPSHKLPVLTKFPAAFVEVGLFFGLAILAFAAQVFLLNNPLLSQLFDSLGYMWTAGYLQKALSWNQLSQIAHFVLSGCPPEGRAALLASMPGLTEIIKTGPVLPAMLAAAYSILHKPLISSQWASSAWLMIVTSALTIVPVWFWARKIGGVGAARIAALLTVFYSGFGVNAARVLSEIPGIFVSVAALLSFVIVLITSASMKTEYAEGSTRNERRRQKRGATLMLAGLSLLSGLLIGQMMLARPTLLPVPIILLACALLTSHFNRLKGLIRPSMFIGLAAGIILVFSPWLVCKLVLTGTPSIMVERYGPYNLCAGMDLRTDGWDVLPSEMVSHPNRFKLTMSEVLKQIARQAREQPAAFCQMLLRKPCRLIDTPWNDFQIRYLGIPWLIQRFLHQLILLCGALGILMMLGDGWKRKNVLLVASGTVLGSFVCYHFISCIFITMSRYFVTAVPELIIPAAYFLSQLKRDRRVLFVLAGLLSAPILSLAIDYLIAPGYGRLSDISSDFGLPQTAWVLAFVLTAILILAIIYPATQVFVSLRGKLAAVILTLPVSIICLISTSHQLMCSEAILKLGAVDRKILQSTVALPNGTECNQWYLIIDANDASTREPDRHIRPLLSGINLRLNGRALEANWQPLLALDNARREEVMYLAAFAYSSGKRATDFRQWIVCALPRENVKEGESNVIELSLKDDGKHPKIFADFCDAAGDRIHSLSLTEFSWSKGFFADTPGEMRLDRFSVQSGLAKPRAEALRVAGAASKLKARMFLLGTNNKNLPNLYQSPPEIFKAPEINIGPHEKEIYSTWDIDLKKNMKESGNTAADAISGRTVRIRVRGEIRSNNPHADGSIALTENYSGGESNYSEFAPLAPQHLPADRNWRQFQFEDYIKPALAQTDLNGVKTGKTLRLSGLKLQFSGRPWWEVLAYGNFKIRSTIQFRNVQVEVETLPAMDLGTDSPQWFELNSAFLRE